MEVSLYQFLKAYNNDLTKSNKVLYGRAISETNDIIHKSFLTRSVQPIKDYMNNASGFRKISLNFLKNLKVLTLKKYSKPLEQIIYFKTRMNIEKKLLNGNKKLDIKLQCGIDKKENSLILLEFGPSNTLNLQARLLKGLLTEFPTEDILTINVDKIQKLIFWELSKGTEIIEDFSIVKPISRKELIETGNRLIS